MTPVAMPSRVRLRIDNFGGRGRHTRRGAIWDRAEGESEKLKFSRQELQVVTSTSRGGVL
jgi:hypothetical protein